MKRYAVLAALLLFLLPDIARTAELTFQPRLETGMMYYSFESKGYSITRVSSPIPYNTGHNFSQSSFEFTGIMPYATVGATFFFRRFFLDIGGQYALSGSDSTLVQRSQYFPVSHDAENDYLNTVYTASKEVHSADFDRRESAISLGYELTSNCSVFVGYKWAETQFDVSYRGEFTRVGYDSDEDLDGQSGWDLWGHANFRFKYSGPFAGAVQGWNFSGNRFFNGTLTASLALAYLESNVELKNNQMNIAMTWLDDQPVAGEPVNLVSNDAYSRLDAKGETLGLTLGIGWRGNTVVDELTYHVGVSAYRYEFDAKSYESGLNDDVESDINESALLLKLGMSYSF